MSEDIKEVKSYTFEIYYEEGFSERYLTEEEFSYLKGEEWYLWKLCTVCGMDISRAFLSDGFVPKKAHYTISDVRYAFLFRVYDGIKKDII